MNPSINIPLELLKEFLLGNAWYRPFQKDSPILALVKDYNDIFKLIETPTSIEVWDTSAWYIQARLKAERYAKSLEENRIIKEELEQLQTKLNNTIEILGSEGFKDILIMSVGKGFKPSDLSPLEIQKILKYLSTGELKCT